MAHTALANTALANTALPALPVVAEVVRSGFVEGRHTGSAVAVRPDGSRPVELGRPEQPVFPRSSNKPLQAVALLDCGLDIDGELLAVATASHSGEDTHIRLVRELLARAGLGEDALGCPPSLPLDEAAATALLRSGAGPTRLHMNCSGKHAAMLTTCVVNGWPTGSYLDEAHPLQVAISATIERVAGEPVAAVGVDGCAAPQHALSLVGLARAYGRLVCSAPGTSERRVADAMRAHPGVVGGTGRDVTQLMEVLPGLLAKDGAEGVYAVALADGTGVALKIEDGAARARTPLLLAILAALGIRSDGLEPLATTPVLGGGVPVGEVRALRIPAGQDGVQT